MTRTDKKVKVLHYAPGFNSGGIESRLLDWYRNVDRSKIEFFLLKLNDLDDTSNIREFTSLGGKFYNLLPFNITTAINFFKSLDELFKSQKFNIVHIHDLSTGIFVLYFAKKAGIECRIIHSRTTDYLPYEKNLFLKKILKKVTPKYATNYFACSHEAGVWGFGIENTSSFKVIKNGIQVERFQHSDTMRNKVRKELNISDKFVVGSVSRLSPQKNLLFLIDLFKELKKTEDNTILIIVGEGSMREILEERIKEFEIKDSVLLIGEKHNIWEYYMAFDVFVSTSFYEGFGTTAIESQATGTPTVLSTGFPQSVVISNYINRLEIKTDIQEWVDTVKSYKNTNIREEGIENVIEHGFNVIQIAKNLEKFYLENQ